MKKSSLSSKSKPDTNSVYKKLLAIIGLVLALVIIGLASYLSYLFFASPSVIRSPYMQHYHFRMQAIVDGEAQNFADSKYQTSESNASCNATLANEPFHFHDNKNQITHVHWDGMTGGLFLKDYGWNYVGGIDGMLGYRFDNLPRLVKVPIHGHQLPAPAAGDNFYVYTGSQYSHKARSFSDFLNQDLETFFGNKSNLRSSKPASGLLDLLFPKVYAHHLDEQQLTTLNNLIGNVVIFVQKQKPTEAQVANHFSLLEPLSDSVCGS